MKAYEDNFYEDNFSKCVRIHLVAPQLNDFKYF